MASSTFAEMFPGLLGIAIAVVGYLVVLRSSKQVRAEQRAAAERRAVQERPAE